MMGRMDDGMDNGMDSGEASFLIPTSFTIYDVPTVCLFGSGKLLNQDKGLWRFRKYATSAPRHQVSCLLYVSIFRAKVNQHPPVHQEGWISVW